MILSVPSDLLILIFLVVAVVFVMIILVYKAEVERVETLYMNEKRKLDEKCKEEKVVAVVGTNAYYKVNDPYKGWTCTLTHRVCREDCTKCVFASVAFAAEIKRREEEGE